MTRVVGASLILILVVTMAGVSAAADEETWQNVSDVGVASLLLLSVGLPAAEGDWTGALQATESFVVASLVTEGLKALFPRLRPDGADDKSFPSGHTSRSFAAASTLYERQGSGVGIPAFVVAGLVGVARVEGDKHYWGDVAAGAVIGTASGFLMTDAPAEPSSVAIVPWGTSRSGGITVSVSF